MKNKYSTVPGSEKHNKPVTKLNPGKMKEESLPMKPFKGTKSVKNEPFNRDERVENLDTSRNKNKLEGVVDFTEESEPKRSYPTKCDLSSFMSKLEQFSSVWSDGPTQRVQNHNVGSSSQRGTHVALNNKTNNFEHKKETFKGKQDESLTKFKHDKFLNNKSNNNYEHKKKVLAVKQKEDLIQAKPCDEQHKNQTETETSVTKHADLKRRKAVEEHRQLHDGQKRLIKQALSSLDGKNRPNTKIVFSDAEEHEGEDQSSKEKEPKRQKLFDDDEDDNDNSRTETALKLNYQFEGKKGQKLLELQTKFASDSRFNLDSRFYESNSEESESEVPEKTDYEEEKKRQLSILESIIKQPIKPLSEIKKNKRNSLEDTVLLRFDPTREDHKKYIIEPQGPSQEKSESRPTDKKRKEKKKSENKEVLSAKETEGKTEKQVSNEKYFAVKEDLKEVLKGDGGEGFSLLKLFGSKESEESDKNLISDRAQPLKKPTHATRNPFKYDSSDSEDEVEDKKNEKETVTASSQPTVSWVTPFFFTENDPRLQEAFEFLKCPEEPEDSNEFAEKRKLLKDFIRHKVKNANRKKTLFKKKLGGLKKKKPFQNSKKRSRS